MKITALKENLKKALSFVERATGSGSTLPILKNILLETDDNRIKLTATDLEIGISFWLNGKIEDKGGITVPAGIFNSVLSNISSSKLELETEKEKLKLKTENSKNYIQGLKKDDFPIVPKVKSDQYLEIKSADLFKSLNQTISAAAAAGRRPELNGVLFWVSRDGLKIAATDGFRLAERKIESVNFKTNIENLRKIIPLRSAQEVLRLCETNSKVKILIDDSQIFFDFGDACLFSRLVEGNFPDYSEKIPAHQETEVIINKKELFDAIKLASVFVGKITDIKLKSGAKELEISGNDANIGENKSDVKGEISGKEQILVLNYRYLIDGIKVIDDSELFLGLNGEINPVFIKSKKDESYFYILMPIRSGS